MEKIVFNYSVCVGTGLSPTNIDFQNDVDIIGVRVSINDTIANQKANLGLSIETVLPRINRTISSVLGDLALQENIVRVDFSNYTHLFASGQSFSFVLVEQDPISALWVPYSPPVGAIVEFLLR